MRVAFHYPSRCMSRPIDPVTLWTNERGLTGSEVACFRYAIELGKLGHDVEVLTNTEHVYESCGVTFKPDNTGNTEWLGELVYDSAEPIFAAVLSWMADDACREAALGSFRIYNEQCSDFGNTQGRGPTRSSVDIFASLSQHHARHMSTQTDFARDQFRVMPNGVDTEEYKPGVKVPGKCIWASSHDRGLHHILEIWPEVKRRVPHAELHVFYDPSGMQSFSEAQQTGTPWVDELARRSAYSLVALERLAGFGVHMHGSVSRNRLREEMATAEVLAYPCDPVRYTETFGSTVLESMASGCVPVLCLSDAFGELWGPACPAISPPYRPQAYLDLLCAVLTNNQTRQANAESCREYSKRFEWSFLGKKLERMIETRGADGFDRVQW